MKLGVAALVVVLGLCGTCSAQASLDKVDLTAIPEIPSYNHSVYAGYLNVTAYDKAYYYMLFKSQNEQDSDPIVLWLSGEPGLLCSPLTSMFTQNGPFVFERGQKSIKNNLFSWNLKAHLLSIEAPGGVGFSKAKNVTTNDTMATQDLYVALVQFFDRFENLKDNDFYLTGEGYAGVFATRLANEIIANNQQETAQERKINIKGILVGNPCIHPNECYSAKYLSRYQAEFLYTRGFIDATDYSYYLSQCLDIGESTADCQKLQYTLLDAFKATNASMYNVFDTCYGSNSLLTGCMDVAGVSAFLNNNQYRNALHVKELSDTLKWETCRNMTTFPFAREKNAAYFNSFNNPIKYGLKVWYYSGDFDLMVPIGGTIDWIKMFRNQHGTAVKKNWRPWLWGGSKLGGMVWELEGLSFYSFVGAGHHVARDQPEAALSLLYLFLGKAGVALSSQ